MNNQPLEHIISQIRSWMSIHGNNAIEPGSTLHAFDVPLVGCARGDDDLFLFLKEDIGPDFYWTPLEAYSHAFPGECTRADELSVIAWVLPQTEHTRQRHRQQRELPSIEWSRSRHYGEQINENLRRHMVELFRREGTQACAPTLLPQWSREESGKYGYASRWSERHAAYVCGLGTFGISDGLITPAGKAVRVGSIIIRKRLAPTTREYTRHDEWCLYTIGKCLVCARRCPVGAISRNGHDKVKCRKYIRNVTSAHVEREQLGFRVNSCGLCQVKVPCEGRNPFEFRLKKC